MAELLLLKHIRLYGLGTNLTCYGAIIPKNENLSLLVGACAKAGAALPHPAPHGLRRESSSIYLIEQGNLRRASIICAWASPSCWAMTLLMAQESREPWGTHWSWRRKSLKSRKSPPSR